MSLAKPANIGLRGLQFLWTIIVMAIAGHMIAETPNGSASIVNYSMFVAVLGILSLIYLIPATIRDSLAISPLFPLIVDLLNVLFWFAGAVALAAQLGVGSCDNQRYRNQSGIINDVKQPNRSSRCTEAQALCAFLFFGFFSFLLSTIFSGLNMRGGSVRPGIRR